MFFVRDERYALEIHGREMEARVARMESYHARARLDELLRQAALPILSHVKTEMAVEATQEAEKNQSNAGRIRLMDAKGTRSARRPRRPGDTPSPHPPPGCTDSGPHLRPGTPSETRN